MKELVIGCGSRLQKLLYTSNEEFVNPIRLDINPDHEPDVVWDLEDIPLPFPDNEFDEIHAYEVLEHVGAQGDYKFFFDQFSDFWRILKPNGHIFGTCPPWDSIWAWGEPSHKRVINEGSLVFLSQRSYEEQIGRTAMSDFRNIYSADFEIVHSKITSAYEFGLRAIK